MSSDYRFGGVHRVLGQQALSQLKNSHIMVVGLGGVGSWAAEAIVRSGVGEVSLIDFDEVCLSNTNRQLPATTSNVGKMKVHALAERFKDINPDIKINARDDFFDEESADEILASQPDYVIDAIDSIDAKCLLIRKCRDHKLPLVVSGGAGGLTDPTKIETSDLARSYADPLLYAVRKRLRKEFGFPRGEKKKFHIGCVYSTELPTYPQDDGTVTKDPAKKPKRRLDCHGGLGTLTMITGSFGFVAASYAINEIAEKAQSLTPSKDTHRELTE